MTSTFRPATVEAAGWTISLLELDALHAPLTWVDPSADPDRLAWLPCHGLLCRRGDQVLLVDCGLGVFHDFFDLEVRLTPLDAAIAAAGCSMDDVGTVVLTHVGTSLEQRVEHHPPEHAEYLLGALAAAGTPVEGLPDKGLVTPGVQVRSAPGHRLGHLCLDISAGGERFAFLADVVHAREHVEHPEWEHLHDSDPPVALATRPAWLAELAGTNASVGCSHVDRLGTIDVGPRWADLV